MQCLTDFALAHSLAQHLGHLAVAVGGVLGQLGSFHVTLKSRPSESEDKVTSENIKAVMVRFRKSRRMLGQFQLTNPNLRFLAPKKAAADGTGA